MYVTYFLGGKAKLIVHVETRAQREMLSDQNSNDPFTANHKQSVRPC